jgi:hypothetical protein
MGTGGPFPGGKAQSGRDADHSPPRIDEERMSRSCRRIVSNARVLPTTYTFANRPWVSSNRAVRERELDEQQISHLAVTSLEDAGKSKQLSGSCVSHD